MPRAGRFPAIDAANHMRRPLTVVESISPGHGAWHPDTPTRYARTHACTDACTLTHLT